jgi:hypothetical protein
MDSTTRRTYTLLGLRRADGTPPRITTGRPAGSVLVVRAAGRRLRYRLTDTELYGPHAGTYAAEQDGAAL